jgi:hypothetical protein
VIYKGLSNSLRPHRLDEVGISSLPAVLPSKRGNAPAVIHIRMLGWHWLDEQSHFVQIVLDHYRPALATAEYVPLLQSVKDQIVPSERFKFQKAVRCSNRKLYQASKSHRKPQADPVSKNYGSGNLSMPYFTADDGVSHLPFRRKNNQISPPSRCQ